MFGKKPIKNFASFILIVKPPEMLTNRQNDLKELAAGSSFELNPAALKRRILLI